MSNLPLAARVLRVLLLALVALLFQGCSSTPGPIPTSDYAQPIQGAVSANLAFQLALNPAKTELYPGEQIVMSAILVDPVQEYPKLQWSILPMSDYEVPMSGLYKGERFTDGSMYGTLSSDSGASVIYTAPYAFPVSVLVKVEAAEAGESEEVLLTTLGPPIEMLGLDADPLNIVLHYYASLQYGVDTGDFAPAYEFLSSERQAERSLDVLSSLYADTKTIQVNAAERIPAVSAGRIPEADADVEAVVTLSDSDDNITRYDVVLHLVKEEVGWRIRGSTVKQLQ